MAKSVALAGICQYYPHMGNTTDRKYNKTKFESVFWRQSAKRDPRTGQPDRVYSIWFAIMLAKATGKPWAGIAKASAPKQPALPEPSFLPSSPTSAGNTKTLKNPHKAKLRKELAGATVNNIFNFMLFCQPRHSLLRILQKKFCDKKGRLREQRQIC